MKGEPETLYNQIKKDIGNQVILTSGVRNIVKQMHFLAKAIEANGNLSRAFRTLLSWNRRFRHRQDLLWVEKFTTAFSRTTEYQKFARLDYVDIRYPAENLFGVRFEPWYIK